MGEGPACADRRGEEAEGLRPLIRLRLPIAGDEPGPSMRIRVEGHGGKPPLVFIHGAGASATTWLEVFRHFERTRKVVAPDLPSHGQSDAWHDVADEQRIAHYRDAVGVACAHLKIDKAVLVGHSMGGLIALSAAAAYPDKVAGVVLVNAALGMRVDKTLLDALRDRPAQQAEILAEVAWSPATQRDRVDRWMRTVTSAEPHVTLADLRAVDAFADVSPSVRTLIIGGQDDLLCPPSLVNETARRMQHGEAHVLPDVGHYAHLENAADTTKLIEQFLAFV